MATPGHEWEPEEGRTWRLIRKRPRIYGLPEDPNARPAFLTEEIQAEASGRGHEVEVMTMAAITVLIGPSGWVPDTDRFHRILGPRSPRCLVDPYHIVGALADAVVASNLDGGGRQDIIKAGPHLLDVQDAVRSLGSISGESLGIAFDVTSR